MQSQINHFLDTLDLSANTIATYRYALQRFVQIVGEDAPLNAKTYEEFLAAIKGFSPSTKQIWRSAVLGLYSFSKVENLAEIKGITRHYSRNQGKRVVNFNREAIDAALAQQLVGSLEYGRARCCRSRAAGGAFVWRLAGDGHDGPYVNVASALARIL
jgi:site-specific recombinase XerD